MKKKMLMIIALLILIATTASTVSAEAQMVMVPSGFVDGEHFTVVNGHGYPGIGNFYYAAYPSLVQDFIDCVDFTVTFIDSDGDVVLKLTPEVVRQLWSEPTPQISGDLYPGIRSLSWATWRVPLAELPPGDYEMRTELEFAHEVEKGCDMDGDGEDDTYLPEDFNKEYVVYIHITG